MPNSRTAAFFPVLSGKNVVSCSDFLEYKPKGTISGEQLNTPERLDQMVTAAYAQMGNDIWWRAHSHMWAWGSVRSDDALKGGGSVSDQYPYHRIEVNNLTQIFTVKETRNSQ